MLLKESFLYLTCDSAPWVINTQTLYFFPRANLLSSFSLSPHPENHQQFVATHED